ncbi:MAG: DEAD/DEAH box helicase [Myxococcales bacterium]|nr:DEAD/DEAH box helicase [Myxococcales bacterium]
MAAAIRFRAWQKEALAKLEARVHASFLAVATPGAGKTTFALGAIRRALVARQVRRCVVVVPTQHLKLQWALAAERFDIHLDPDWSAGDGALPSDVHGVAVTYQQVAANPGALRRLVAQAFVVLDEIHHAAEARSWGDGIRHAFDPAPVRLCLSGTPFRSDQSAIPFVRYVGDEAQADYEYGYGEALRDRRVVRPVYFPRINGRMEWTAPDGTTYAAGFDDPLSRNLASQRLRTALDVEGEWLPAVLAKAHRQVLHLRETDPRAAGMVIAMDQEHARGIAALLRRYAGAHATVAVSDDPAASRKIADFAAGEDPWIVAVRMVSEGVDIPRLKVGVYATNTITDLFFRQAVGRLVRTTAGARGQRAYMFIPDDPRLRLFAANIAEQRRHSLRRPDDRERDEIQRDPDAEARAAEEADQLSLFTAISAIPLDEHGNPLDASPVAEPATVPHESIPGLVDDEPELEPRPTAAEPFRLVAPELEGPVPEPEPDAPADAAMSPRTRKRKLREQNSAAVRALAHRIRKPHAEINAVLNRRIGIQRITEATSPQLERRLALARRWLEQA